MTAVPDLSTLAGQRAHYAAVNNRLMNPLPRITPDHVAQSFWFGVCLGLQMRRQEASKASIDSAWVTNMVMSVVCDTSGLRKDQLAFTNRDFYVSQARHVGIYLMKAATSLSNTNIAKQFGGRDNSTARHPLKFVERKLVIVDHEILAAVEEIRDCREHGVNRAKFEECLRRAAKLLLHAYERFNGERRRRQGEKARLVHEARARTKEGK